MGRHDPDEKPRKRSDDKYKTIGGPASELYLPHPVRIGKPIVPDEVPYPQQGVYKRRFDPEGGDSYYEWIPK